MKKGNWHTVVRRAGLVVVFCAVQVSAVDKSGVEANVISVPGGPGSIEGLGESYQPNLNSGTAKYGVPIDLPPGTAGHAPSIALSYDGGGPNGPLGFGWGLSLPYVQRQTDEGIPRYVDGPDGINNDGDGLTDEPDEQDSFINSDREELVQLANGNFFCKNESAFIRYRRVADYWEGTMPDGTRILFGQTAAARITDAAGTRVFRWLCEKEIDPHGNVIEYSYRPFIDNQNINQKYLHRIAWGPAAAPWTHYHFMTCTYEARPDWFEQGTSGFLIRTGMRLKEIAVGTQGVVLNGHLAGDFDEDGTSDYLVAKYVLDYYNYGPNTHWSYIGSITPIGADGVSALPPTTFEYSVCNPPDQVNAAPLVVGGLNEPSAVMDDPHVDLIDFNADGLPDILSTPGGGLAHVAYLNEGEVDLGGNRFIQWAPARQVDAGFQQAWNFDLATIIGNLATLADMNGDGTSDFWFYQSASQSVSFFENLSTNVAWSAQKNMQVQNNDVPPSPLTDPEVGMADLDFDKRTDIIRTSNNGFNVEIWFNLGNQSYSRRFSSTLTTPFSLSAPGVSLADFNGDRMPDMTRIGSTTVQVAAGIGRGNYAAQISVGIPDVGLTTDQIGRARLRDLTGDGLVDLVIERASGGSLWYWVNKGNYTFSNLKVLSGMPTAFSPSSTTRWADMNGNGTIDLCYADSSVNPRMRTYDIGRIIGCRADMNMLTKINNGIGLVTEYVYDTSTRFVLADRVAGRPWRDIMPFPMNVVAEVTENDSLGHLYETEYRYHHGFYEIEEKEFRGFGEVERVDVGDATAPTLVTRSFFDQGKEHEALQGKLLRQTTETEQGDVFNDTTTTWSNPPRTLYTGVFGQPVLYVYPEATLEVVKELGQGTERRTETEFTYDNYGNVTETREWGIVENGDRLAFNDERFTQTEYAINTTAWQINLPARVEVGDENGVLVSKTEYYYDDPSFSGSNFGQVSKGNLTLSRGWVDPAVASDFINVSRTIFDVYGNETSSLDPLSPNVPDPAQGHYTVAVFDPHFRSYVIEDVVHVGAGQPPLVRSTAYDQGFGLVVSSEDYNGNVTRYEYDVFGRPTATYRPLDVPGYPSVAYDYQLAVPFGTGVVNFSEMRMLDKTPASQASLREHYLISRTYSDGMRRTLMQKEEAGTDADSGAPLVVVNGAVIFNARKTEYRALNPYYSTAADPWIYEDLLSPTWEGRFHDEGLLVSLDLAQAHQSLTTYDALGRVRTTINPDGTQSAIEYEPFVTRALDEHDVDPTSPHFQTPNLTHSDGLGRAIRMDRVVKINDDGSPSANLNTWTVQYEYDLNDMRTRAIDAQNNVRAAEYDGLMRLTRRLDPDQGTTQITYNEVNKPVETIDNKGQRTTFTYDGANRLLTIDYHDAGQAFAQGRTYDPNQVLNPPLSEVGRLFDHTVTGPVNFPDVYFGYDSSRSAVDLGDGTTTNTSHTIGRRSVCIDLTGAHYQSFDERGRVVAEIRQIADPASGDLVAYTTRNAFDIFDRPTAIICPDNDAIFYEHNDRNRVSRIYGTRAGDILTDLTYTPSGTMNAGRFGNGVKTESRFDARGRTQRIQAGPAEEPGRFVDYAYAYDAVSNILEIDDLRPNLPATDPHHDSRSFVYDSLYRLTQYRLTDTAQTQNRGQIDYRHDRISNMLFAASPDFGQPGHIAEVKNGFSLVNQGEKTFGGSAGASGRGVRGPGDEPGPGALTSTADGHVLVYDGNGNVEQRDDDTLSWDFRNRLVAVSNQTQVARYTYDFAGGRTVRSVEHRNDPSKSFTTIYVNRGFEIRANQQPVKYVFFDDRRIARIDGTYSAVANRIQRFSLAEGWNLLSMAVEHPTALAQLGLGSDASIESCVRYGQDGAYTELNPGDDLPAGAVFWLKSTKAQVLEVSGTYAEAAGTPVGVGGVYIPSPGLEAVPLCAGLPDATSVWYYDAHESEWRAFESGELPSPHNPPPELLAPGAAVFVKTDAPITLPARSSASRIRYYHVDHLGNLVAASDANGGLTERRTFYPFGNVRHQTTSSDTEEHYTFTGKEQDVESSLFYFGARYYDPTLATWLSVDPLVDLAPGLSPYNYVKGNPLSYVDPDGRWPKFLKRLFGSKKKASRSRNNPMRRSVSRSGLAKSRGADSPFSRNNLHRSNSRSNVAGRPDPSSRVARHHKLPPQRSQPDPSSRLARFHKVPSANYGELPAGHVVEQSPRANFAAQMRAQNVPRHYARVPHRPQAHYTRAPSRPRSRSEYGVLPQPAPSHLGNVSDVLPANAGIQYGQLPPNQSYGVLPPAAVGQYDRAGAIPTGVQ